ncbi:hypothetical protein BGX23_012404 [Mortierella sp. AD031]|nr:hypothetical protein BGX23_012404 [Mortierella sp. AD031]
MSRISDPDKGGDPFNRDDSLELDRMDHHHQAAANRYQIDPLSDNDDDDDDLDGISEHHTLTGKKEALLKKHSDDPSSSSSSSSDTSDPNQSPYNHRDDDTDTIDVHIIPLSTSEAIDRQRGDLQKNVTFSNGLTLVVGVIIGSGIFASPGPVFAYSKSVGVSLIIWFVSGLLAFAGSLCYAELGSAMPSSGGGEHAYLNHAFGSLPAFLFSWSSIALLKVVFAEYVVNIIAQSAWDPTQPMRHWSNKLLAIACVLVLSGLNSISVSVGTRIQDVFTFIKVVTLLVIGIAGLVVLGQKSLSSHNFDHAFEGSSKPSLGDIALGLYSGLWAYDGWNNLNYVSSEMKNPTKDLPRVIFAGVPIVILFYLLANTAYYAVLPEEVVMSTNTIAIDFGKQMFGNTGGVLYLSSILGLLYLRCHEPNLKRPFKVWLVVPILFTFLGLFLFLMPFVRAPLESCLSMVIVLAGLPLWLVKELVSGNRGTRWQDLKEKVLLTFGITPAGGRHERLVG